MNAAAQQTRRRFLRGLGGSLLALPMAACRKPQGGLPPEPEGGVYRWSGIGFGIAMSMEIHDVSETQGNALGGHCERIIDELEQAFSLYREDSELSRLNRERQLVNPSPRFVELLDQAVALEALTLGYFQPAIHGAWQWLESHDFRIESGQRELWRRQCAAASTRHLERRDDGVIRLTHPLTRLSMNAIGQGFLADLVATKLKREGVGHALLHLGETRALGGHPDGRPWKLGVMGTGEEADLVGEIELTDAGLAVSANEAGRLLIDPVAAALQQHDRVAAVVTTQGATVADAFATAFAVAPRAKWRELGDGLLRQGGGRALVWQQNVLVHER